MEIYRFCFVLLCIWGQFPSTSPRGAYIWRSDLTEDFLRYEFGGLIFGGAYFRSFTVFFLHFPVLDHISPKITRGHHVFTSKFKFSAEKKNNKTKACKKSASVISFFHKSFCILSTGKTQVKTFSLILPFYLYDFQCTYARSYLIFLILAGVHTCSLVTRPLTIKLLLFFHFNFKNIT